MAQIAAFAAANAATLQAIGTVVSVVSSISSAQAQAQQQRIAAVDAELQGRTQALRYKEQGVAVLQRQAQLASIARARAAAGGVDPLTGSPMTIQQVDAMRAGEEYQKSVENAEMAIYGGLAESQSLRAASRATMTTGLLSAGASGLIGLSQVGKLATPTIPTVG